MFEDNPCFLSLVCARVKKKRTERRKDFLWSPTTPIKYPGVGCVTVARHDEIHELSPDFNLIMHRTLFKILIRDYETKLQVW